MPGNVTDGSESFSRSSVDAANMVFFEGARQSNGAGFPANDPPDGWIHYNTSDNQLYIRANGAWTAVFAQNQTQTYYVGKHGNDANDGLHPDNAVLTIGQAITLANAQTPTTTNRFRLQVVDGGIYEEDITLASWLFLHGPDATLKGTLTIQDDALAELHEIKRTSAGVLISKTSSSGEPSWVHVSRLTPNSGSNCIEQTHASAILVLHAEVIEADNCYGIGGSGLKGKIFIDVDYINVTNGKGGIRVEDNTAAAEIAGRVGKIEADGTSNAIGVSEGSVALVVGEIDAAGTAILTSADAGSVCHVWVSRLTGTLSKGAGSTLHAIEASEVFLRDGTIAMTGDLDMGTNAVINVGNVDGRDVSVDGTKLDGIEAAATADQTDAEIETAYNNQVAQVSAGEKTAGTETAIRRFSPEDVADMAEVHGFEGNAHPGVTTGDYILPVGCVAQVNNGTTLAGEIDYLPVCVGESVTIDRLAIHVNAGSPGTNCRIAIYDNANGRPNSLIGESGIITTTVGGLKTYTLSQALEPGWYWVASQVNAATATFKRCASTETLAVIGATVLSTRYNCYYETHVYGAFPATASITGVRSRNVPIVGLRAT